MQLNQVIVEFDTENGLFKFVELSDLLTAFAPRTKQKHEVIDLLLTFGALFDFSIVSNPSIEMFADTVSRMSQSPDKELNHILNIVQYDPP